MCRCQAYFSHEHAHEMMFLYKWHLVASTMSNNACSTHYTCDCSGSRTIIISRYTTPPLYAACVLQPLTRYTTRSFSFLDNNGNNNLSSFAFDGVFSAHCSQFHSQKLRYLFICDTQAQTYTNTYTHSYYRYLLPLFFPQNFISIYYYYCVVRWHR